MAVVVEAGAAVVVEGVVAVVLVAEFEGVVAVPAVELATFEQKVAAVVVVAVVIAVVGVVVNLAVLVVEV